MDTIIPINRASKFTENPVRAYLKAVKELILEPGRFFRYEALQYSLSEALTLGLVSLWLSQLITFFWRMSNKLLFMRLMETWLGGLSLGDEFGTAFSYSQKDFVTEAGFLLLSPFGSLMGLGFSALVLLSFGKLFISDEDNPVFKELQLEREAKVNFSNCLKILGFASVGSWLRIVPFFGGFLSYFSILLLTLIGVREMFQVSTKRASLVVVLPQLLFFMFLFLLIGAGILLIFILPWDQILQSQDWQDWSSFDEDDAESAKIIFQYLFFY